MTPSSNGRRRGVTLIELLVTSALFGLFTGMVAAALILAHRTQDQSVAKLDAVRHASLAEDILAREIEAARFNSAVTLNGSPLLTTPQRPLVGTPLLVLRNRPRPGGSGPTDVQRVCAMYWFEPHPDETAALTFSDTTVRPTLPGTIRRTIFDDEVVPRTVLPEETVAGRVMARDVMDFQLSEDGDSPQWLTKIDVWVNTVGNPVTTFVASILPPGIN